MRTSIEDEKMANVLTEGASVTCPHAPGAVELVAGQQQLMVGGVKALVQGDLAGKPISGCVWAPPPPANVPCTLVDVVAGGVATKLKVGGKGVLLDTGVPGLTNGKPGPFPLIVQDPGQDKLTAV